MPLKRVGLKPTALNHSANDAVNAGTIFHYAYDENCCEVPIRSVNRGIDSLSKPAHSVLIKESRGFEPLSCRYIVDCSAAELQLPSTPCGIRTHDPQIKSLML